MSDEQGFTVNDPEHLQRALEGVPYGIFDTQDNCWLGTEAGPRLYTREDSEALNGLPLHLVAKIAAQMAGIQLGYAPGRLQAREFDGEDLRLKDLIQTKMTALEALVKLESGEKQ